MYIIYTRVLAKLRTLPSANVLLFAGSSQQGECLLITDRVVNIKISQCGNTSVMSPRYSHLPDCWGNFLPGRPDVHNSIETVLSPRYHKLDDTTTSITTVWLIISATFLNRPSWLLILMRSRTRGSFPFHMLWDSPPFTVELWQRRLAATESPRTAAGRPCTLLFACIGSNTTPPLWSESSAGEWQRRLWKTHQMWLRDPFIAHMFSGKQRELADRRSKQNGLNRATGGSGRRKYTQIMTFFVNIYTRFESDSC